MLSEPQILEQTNQKEWFNNMVAALRTDEFMLETQIASPQMKRLYDVMMNGSANDIQFQSKQAAQMHFVRNILLDYVQFINSNTLPEKLAVDFNDSEVLVWAEIEDGDEQMERALLIAEAKVNAKYHHYGYDMETTIVETSDSLPIPNHYQSLK